MYGAVVKRFRLLLAATGEAKCDNTECSEREGGWFWNSLRRIDADNGGGVAK